MEQIPFFELANETSKLGHELAEKIGFEYPTRAEMVARNTWSGINPRVTIDRQEASCAFTTRDACLACWNAKTL